MAVHKASLIMLVASGFLAACGGGNADRESGIQAKASSAFACSPVGGGGAAVSSSGVNSPGYAVSNAGLAIDTDLDTAAGLTLFHPDDNAAQQSQINLRGTAQKGVVFPAGSKAGLVIGLPTGKSVRYSATVTTYLSGVQQDSRVVVPGNVGATNGELRYFGFDATIPTTRAFDAVELSITETAPSVERHDYRVSEFCSDGTQK